MKRLDFEKRSWIVTLVLFALLGGLGALGCADDGDDGAPGAKGEKGDQGDPGDPGGDLDPVVALEACVGCHSPGTVKPVGDITDMMDVHYVDTDPDGPLTDSGYRQLNVAITAVDVSRTVDPDSVIIDFEVTDENGADVTDLFASDGRFTIARLNPGVDPGDADFWLSFITRTEGASVQANSERFSSGTFQANTPVAGSYRYTSSYDPATAPAGVNPIAGGDALRVAIQLSAGDLPAGNGWCDFDANLGAANNNCNSASRTRDIVQTATCNGCHGVTSDTKLAIHGGGRTDVEYCVTCHNPGTTDDETGNVLEMPILIHKIHYGAELENGYQVSGFGNNLHDYSHVEFTKDIDDCTNCHTGGGADEDNWSTVPTMNACGSCHDDVNFATGENHPSPGGVQTSNAACTACHPQGNPGDPHPPPGGFGWPVETMHTGVARRAEGSLYSGADGFSIDSATFDASSDELTVNYSVSRDGMSAVLDADDEWTAGGGASRLALTVGWDTEDYTNENSGSSSPAQPISINALDVGGAVSDLGGGAYQAVVDLPSSATNGSVAVGLEGHPAADLDLDGTFSDRIAVKNDVLYVDAAQGRSMGAVPRRAVVDIDKCNQCHDSAGNGLSLHGNNRTGTDEVCVVCHNGDATDIGRRPPPPTADGKLEEAVHFRRMIHQIHSGAELEEGVIIYGFGGSVHDFSHVEFIGNRMNCETCHLPGTYSAEDALLGVPTTIDTGADVADSEDDLNISHTAAVCSSCHDGTAATDHMKLNGASFHALDADIH
jgi:OmcA/MtrC family decaheme c-type cytochrome